MGIIDKIKNYLLGGLAAIAALFLALFFFERNKAEVNEALLKEQKLNNDLQKYDDHIANNNEALKAEEAKREEIKKEPVNEPSDQNIIDLFNNRK